MEIADWRAKIDGLDEQIVKLLCERAAAAAAIGALKMKSNANIYEPDREQERAAARGQVQHGRTAERPVAGHLRTHYGRYALAAAPLRNRSKRRTAPEIQGSEGSKMIVVMQGSATGEHIQAVIEQMVELGFNVHRTSGAGQMILAGVGNPGQFDVARSSR